MSGFYHEWTYIQLKKECSKRGLGGGGKRDELLSKLVADDRGEVAPRTELDRQIANGAKATDPNPDNLNYDLAGRWRRRPSGFVCWNPDGTADIDPKRILRKRRTV